MRENIDKVFWKGKLIGEIIEPTINMFFLYGKWKPKDSLETNEFIKEIIENRESVIQIGNSENGLKGIVEFVPTDEIEMKLYPNL